jgi:hypothetical protein
MEKALSLLLLEQSPVPRMLTSLITAFSSRTIFVPMSPHSFPEEGIMLDRGGFGGYG